MSWQALCKLIWDLGHRVSCTYPNSNLKILSNLKGGKRRSQNFPLNFQNKLRNITSSRGPNEEKSNLRVSSLFEHDSSSEHIMSCKVTIRAKQSYLVTVSFLWTRIFSTQLGPNIVTCGQ